MRRLARNLALGVVLLTLSGCPSWPMPGQNPDRTGHNAAETPISPATVGDLEELWAAPTPTGRPHSVSVSDAGIHVSAGGSTLYTFATATGAELWQRNVDPAQGFALMGPTVFDGEGLWIGYGVPNLGGRWIAEILDPSTGAIIAIPKKTGVPEGARGTRTLLRRVGFGSGGPIGTSISVVDTADSSRTWDEITFAATSGAFPPALTLGENFVYQATPAGGTQTSALSSFCGPDCGGFNTLLDGTRGTSPVAGGGGSVFVGTDAGTMFAVDGTAGAIQWSRPMGAAVSATPALAHGVLYVPVDGNLVALDASSGAILWTGAAGSAIGHQPAVVGGVVFTGSADGTVQAFDAAGCGSASCTAIWSVDTGDAGITTAPAISEDQLYVGTSDQRVLAFGLPT